MICTYNQSCRNTNNFVYFARSLAASEVVNDSPKNPHSNQHLENLIDHLDDTTGSYPLWSKYLHKLLNLGSYLQRMDYKLLALNCPSAYLQHPTPKEGNI
jgi:hypothetical protein